MSSSQEDPSEVPSGEKGSEEVERLESDITTTEDDSGEVVKTITEDKQLPSDDMRAEAETTASEGLIQLLITPNPSLGALWKKVICHQLWCF